MLNQWNLQGKNKYHMIIKGIGKFFMGSHRLVGPGENIASVTSMETMLLPTIPQNIYNPLGGDGRIHPNG